MRTTAKLILAGTLIIAGTALGSKALTSAAKVVAGF
jgi:hypothetical protein